MELNARKTTRDPKGKGKMAATDEASLTSRMLLSASGLAKELGGSSTLIDMLHRTSHGSNSSNKASQRTSVPAPLSGAQDLPVRSGHSCILGHPSSSYSSFRSTPTWEVEDHEFNAFLSATPPDLSTFLNQLDTSQEGWMDDYGCWSSFGQDESPVDSGGQYSERKEGSTVIPKDGSSFHDQCMADEEVMTGHGSSMAQSSSEEHHTTDLSDESTALGNLSLKRLQLILGHIAKGIDLTAGPQDRLNSFGNIPQEHPAVPIASLKTSASSRMTFDPTLEVQAPAATPAQVVDQSRAAEPGSGKLNMAQKSFEREGRPEAAKKDESPKSAFHCPWVNCHHRYNDPESLRPYPGARWGYVCAHEGCTAQFQTHNAWMEHIIRPHHNLL